MEKLDSIKFSQLNIHVFSAFLQSAIAGDFSHVIDFTSTSLIARSHPADKSFVKYTECDIKDILKYDAKLPDGFNIKFPLNKGMKKLIAVLNQYKNNGVDTIDGVIKYKDDPSEGLVGLEITLKHKKLNLKVLATEMYLASYLSDESWKRMSNVDSAVAKLVIDSTIVSKLKNLTGYDDKKGFLLVVDKKGNSITFKSTDNEVWSFDYDSDFSCENLVDQKLAIVIPTLLLAHLDYPLADVYVKPLGTILALVVKKDDFNQLLFSTQKQDINLI